MATYNYTKATVNLDRLEQEIGDESLGANIVGTTWVSPDTLDIEFDAALSAGDEATLNATVVNHTAPASKPGETSICLKDGVDEPATMVDGACIYVDVADGNLKVKFGDGVVKTLMTDE